MIRTLVMVIGLAAVLLVNAVLAAPTLANGSTPIIDHNGKCLDALGSTEVVIFSCDGSLSESWSIVGISNGDFLIESDSSHLCLAAVNSVPGAAVVQRACDFGVAAERWFRTDATSNGFFELANRGAPGLVMAPAGCGSANGTRVVMASDNTCLADLWRF